MIKNSAILNGPSESSRQGPYLYYIIAAKSKAKIRNK